MKSGSQIITGAYYVVHWNFCITSRSIEILVEEDDDMWTFLITLIGGTHDVKMKIIVKPC